MENVTFTQFGIFCGCLIAIILVVSALWGMRRNPPLHQEFASKQEHEELKNEVDARLAALSKAGSESREKMHKEIEELKIGVGVVTDQNLQQSKALSEIKVEQANIRSEMKADNLGLTNRLGDVLTGLGEIRGQLKGIFK